MYSTNKTDQFTYIEKAKARGYDVLELDGQLDVHLINHLETKFKESRFLRVDSDVIDKLIQKDDKRDSKLTKEQEEDLKSVFNVKVKDNAIYNVVLETLDENEAPVIITQSEFMRRMKDMSQIGGGMNFYGELPDSYNLVINSNHSLIERMAGDLEAGKEKSSGKQAGDQELKEQVQLLEEEHGKKKPEEVSQLRR